MRRLTLLLSLPALLVAQPATTEMSLQTPDGFTLSGTLTVPQGKGKHPVVILAPAFRDDRTAWTPLVDKLSARGLATLALDLRGHGRSTDQAGTAVTPDYKASARLVGFGRIPEDLAQAADWVRRQKGVDGRHLGLAGAGMGAYAVLLAAPRVHPTTMLALSPSGGEAFGNASLASAAARGRAVLLAYVSEGDAEATKNVEPLKPLFGAFVRSTEGNLRGMDFLANYGTTMTVFFGEYLLHPHSGQATAAPAAKAAEPTTVLTAPGAPAAPAN